MKERILIGVAWPYANGSLHLGHIAGAYLPADIFARYHRLKGNDVLMVSGSDQHGTPISVRAEMEGKSPQAIVDHYHREFLECWERLGISFDLFTTTGTANHREVVHDILRTLLAKGYVYPGAMPLPYCPTCRRFLADRYVEGTCPSCGFPHARGDQCDRCGKPLNPDELLEPRCSLCGTRPEIRESKHLFLRLSAFEKRLKEWVGQQTHWRPNVFSLTNRYLKEGLRDRAITRDIEWGIPVPVSGFEQKRIYVWFEAVIGYLSASKEWAKLSGDEERWCDFWQGEAKTYYFIGKDNIPFHTIIWPAILMGYGGLNLPYDVPANEFLTLEGRPLSTSRGWAIWLPDFLERYEPDALRYFLSAGMPETGDADFSWREFLRRVNDELVATYGNLVHRVLSFTYRNFKGIIPSPGELDARDNKLLANAEETLHRVDGLLGGCRFREGIRCAFGLAQEANRYLDEKAPWKSIKQDRRAAETAVAVCLGAISCLKTILLPYLPFSSMKLHRLLSLDGRPGEGGWGFSFPLEGKLSGPPEPLFSKLPEEIVAQEMARLHGAEGEG